MIIGNKNTSLEIVLGAIPATEMDWYSSYRSSPDSYAGTSKNGTTNGTTAVTIVAAPTVPQQANNLYNRFLNSFSVKNKDVSFQTVIIQSNESSTLTQIVEVILDAGFTLHYEESEGWYVTDRSGSRRETIISISEIEIGDTVIGGTNKHFLYVDASGNLADDGYLVRESYGVTLASGKVFKSEAGGGGQLSFDTGNHVELTTDSGAFGEGWYYADVLSSGIGVFDVFVEVTGGISPTITIDPTLAGKVVFTQMTANRVAYFGASNEIKSSAVTSTELGYLSGAASNIQNQINNINSGLKWKNSCRAATTANITLSGSQTIDGVSVISGDRVLVKNQSTAADNGLYLCDAGAWTRTTDSDTGVEMLQATTSIEEGTINGDTIYTCTTNAPITIGVTSLVFAKTSATLFTADEVSLTISSNQFSIKNTWVGQTSITTLGTVSTGTWGATAIESTYGGLGIDTHLSTGFPEVSAGTWSIKTASQMRTDLGLTIGTNVQAWDSDLDSWAAITRASGFDTFAATPSSANLAALVTDETGTGALVFATVPTLTTPILASTAANGAGRIGYDGTVFTNTHVASATGIMPSVMYSIISSSDFNLSTSTGVQSCFESTGDVWTLNGTTTYEVEGHYSITKSGTTCTIAIAFAAGGGASITSIRLWVQGTSSGNASTFNPYVITTNASSVVSTTGTGNGIIKFKGLIRMNAGGTITPQIDFSASPTSPIMKANSYIKFTPLGTNTNNTQGNVA